MLQYNISASIDPGEQTLQADVEVIISPEEDGNLQFCLHRDLHLELVEGDGVTGYSFSEQGVPFAEEARLLDIEMTRTGDPQSVRFKYRGRLGIISKWEVNRISPAWTELGLYAPWYPLTVPMQKAKFRVELHLPANYSLISNGSTEKVDDGWLIQQSEPGIDLTLVIAPELHREQAVREGAVVRASYTQEGAQPAASVFAEIGAEMLAWFNAQFGPAHADPVEIVIAPRLQGGGYARPGFIMFCADVSLDEKVILYRYIGHEFAHLWWYRASTTTWEDWLNEALAEFSALLAIRDILGQETYAKLLAVRREKAANLPPIVGISRDAEEAPLVLYYKGCVILADLEAELGEDRFRAFLRELVHQQISATEKFLAVLAQFGGDSVSRWFAKKLKS